MICTGLNRYAPRYKYHYLTLPYTYIYNKNIDTKYTILQMAFVTVTAMIKTVEVAYLLDMPIALK